ncbi:MAG: WYL domain-containing transcriptional regulator [Clostridiales bacterium]|nr:WYL domain-containing transcriptional regulator [Clostridiales bacterium]
MQYNKGISLQKQKLLIIQSLLLELTDEDNHLTGKQIIEKLERMGISVERKTLYDDIATLNGSGLNIEITKNGHANAYYIGERLFTDEELFVLADAVASSRFLTQKKSSELIKKLQKLTSNHKAKSLRRQIFVENRAKAFNEDIYYTINLINHAVFTKTQIEFKYFTYDIDRKKQYRHGGEFYKVSPYYLIWKDDNYYLIGYSNKREKVVYFRVDRMSNVQLSELKRVELSTDELEIAKNLRTTFNMYSGTPEYITLEVDNSLIDVIVDRFGERTICKRISENTFVCRVDVQISPTFWGWLFSFGNKMKVTAPEWVVNDAKKNIDIIENNYNNT